MPAALRNDQFESRGKRLLHLVADQPAKPIPAARAAHDRPLAISAARALLIIVAEKYSGG